MEQAAAEAPFLLAGLKLDGGARGVVLLAEEPHGDHLHSSGQPQLGVLKGSAVDHSRAVHLEVPHLVARQQAGDGDGERLEVERLRVALHLLARR